MEDDTTYGPPHLGEMVGITTESNDSTYLGAYGPVCYALKNPPYNYQIFVLHVDYTPIPEDTYQTSFIGGTPYILEDYPAIFNTIMRNYNEMTSPPQPPPNAASTGLSPTEAAMQACASPGDFYNASDTSQINQQLSQILKSALSSAIRVTN